MLAAIKDFVVQNKAKLILLDNGSSVVEQALEQLKGDLANRELIAQQKHAQFEQERQQVDKALQKFQGDCGWVLKDLEHAQPDARLAEDFASRLDQTWRSQLADRVAARIFHEVIAADGAIGNLHKVIFRRHELENAIVRIFQSEFESAVGNEIAAWVQQLQDNNNPTYNLEVRDRVDRIQAEMLRLWHETVKENDLGVLRNIPLPHLAGNVWQAQRQLPSIDAATTNDDLQSIIKRVSLELFGQLCAIKSMIVAIVASVFFHGPPGWIVAAAAVLIGIVVMKLAPDQIIQRLADKIRDDMGRSWGDSEKLIRSGMESFGRGIREWYRQTIEAAIISKPKAVVDQR